MLKYYISIQVSDLCLSHSNENNTRTKRIFLEILSFFFFWKFISIFCNFFLAHKTTIDKMEKRV